MYPGNDNEETKIQVYNGVPITVSYSYPNFKNKPNAFRLYAKSDQATLDYPVIVLVRQKKYVETYEIPELVNMKYSFQFFSRTLCITQDNNDPNITIDIDFSCFAPMGNVTEVLFKLESLSNDKFILTENQKHLANISPVEPQYLQFTFPQNVDVVDVKVNSDSEICMALSIQDIQCPVYVKETNYKYEGFYQTISQKGLVRVQKRHFSRNKFFAVLIAFSDVTQCLDPIITPLYSNVNDTSSNIRSIYYGEQISKNLTIQVEEVQGAFEVDAVPIFFGFALSVIMGIIVTVIYLYYLCSGFSLEKREEIKRRIKEKEERGIKMDRLNYFYSFKQMKDETEKQVQRQKDKMMAKFKRELMETQRAKQYLLELKSLALSYALPAYRMVVIYFLELPDERNQDKCFYNYYCMRPWWLFQSFNSVFVNLTYWLCGCFFIAFTFILSRIATWYDKKNNYERLIPIRLGFYYSMGIALTVEGFMSGLYHVCPTKYSYDYDTTFMYVMSFLTIFKIMEIRHVDIKLPAPTGFYLIALSLTVGSAQSLPWNFIMVRLAIWLIFFANLIAAHWIYYTPHWNKTYAEIFFGFVTQKIYKGWSIRVVPILIITFVHAASAIYFTIEFPSDFFTYVLRVLMGNASFYLIYYMIMKVINKELFFGNDWKNKLKDGIIILVFACITAVHWWFAIVNFENHTQKWSMTPAASRNVNTECVYRNMYDDHDIWHFYSALGWTSMFLSILIMEFLRDDRKEDDVNVF